MEFDSIPATNFERRLKGFEVTAVPFRRRKRAAATSLIAVVKTSRYKNDEVVGLKALRLICEFTDFSG